MVASIVSWMPCPGAGGASDVPVDDPASPLPPSTLDADDEELGDEDDEHATKADMARSGISGRRFKVDPLSGRAFV
jgi:hypothetical protein